MTLLRLTGAVALALMLGGAGAQDAIKARQDNFQLLSDQMKQVVKGLGDGLPISVMREHVWAAQQALHLVPSMFPLGSDVGKTSALPLVWSDPGRFRSVYDAAAARMAELVAAAQGSDRDAFGAAVGRMAAACGQCHSIFRSD